MTYETLESEINAIIEETKKQIADEEKDVKTANYPQFKKCLADAAELQKNIAEGKKYGMEADFFKLDLKQLKNPIY